MRALASPHPAARLVPLAAACALTASLLALAALDAGARRVRASRDRRVPRAAARVVGPELALHAASRWLRHPTRTEPWAPFADGPAVLDTDPAGAVAPPPRGLFIGYGTRVRRVGAPARGPEDAPP